MGTITNKMRFVLLAAFLLCLGATTAQSANRMIGMGADRDSITFDQIADAGLLVVDVETVDHEWPVCDYVLAPYGAWGKSITNANKVPGHLRVWKNGTVAFDTGDYDGYRHGMTIRIRGNTSAYDEKKPYKIDLQDKGDLLLRNTPNYRDKDWILIRDPFYKTLQGLELNRLLGMPWTPAYRYVNLIINNEYQGLYMLLESVKRNNSCRVNVDKRGFFFEYDAYWWNNKRYVPSAVHSSMKYTFKYPSDDDLTDDDLSYFTAMIEDYEASLSDGTYDRQIDVENFATWCLGHDILSTQDAAGTNLFLVKHDRNADTPITIPLLWDFDSTEGDSTRWSRCHYFHFNKLFKSSNREFVSAYVTKWHQVRDILPGSMAEAIDRFQHSDDGYGLIKSVPLNNQRWDTPFLAWGYLLKRAEWFAQRKPWLDQAIEALISRGDVNVDGKVDVLDMNAVLNMILELQPFDNRADLNGDGKVDIDDANILNSIILASGGETPGPVMTLSDRQLSFPAEGGSEIVLIEADADWHVEQDSIPEWLTVSPVSGAAGDGEIIVTAQPTMTDRSACLLVRCHDTTDTITVKQEGAAHGLEVTVAEFLAADSDTTLYRLTGVIAKVVDQTTGTVALRDWSGEVVVDGITATDGGEPDAIQRGNIVTIEGHREARQGTTLLCGGRLHQVIHVSPLAIADFAASPANVYCRMTGTIGEITDQDNGCFFLSDTKGNIIYVEGCAPGWGATGDDKMGVLASIGLSSGDNISVIGMKTPGESRDVFTGFYFSHMKLYQPDLDICDPQPFDGKHFRDAD